MSECVDGVWEGPWAGPSPTLPSCETSVEPAEYSELCFPEGCMPVTYSWFGKLGNYRSAEATCQMVILCWAGAGRALAAIARKLIGKPLFAILECEASKSCETV